MVGASLVIPAQPPGTPSPEPLALVTPTPQPLLVQAPVCYPAADGRLTCLVTVENDQDATLENITAWVGLANAQGESISSQVAIPPLNILTSGERLPLVAIFSPSPEAASPQVRLLSAVPVPAGDQRYARTRLDIQKEIIDPGKLQATLSGAVELLPPRKPAKQTKTATPQGGASADFAARACRPPRMAGGSRLWPGWGSGRLSQVGSRARPVRREQAALRGHGLQPGSGDRKGRAPGRSRVIEIISRSQSKFQQFYEFAPDTDFFPGHTRRSNSRFDRHPPAALLNQ